MAAGITDISILIANYNVVTFSNASGPFDILLIFIYINNQSRFYFLLLPKPPENSGARSGRCLSIFTLHDFAFALKHATCEIPRHPDVILKASFRHHLDIISHINSKTEIKGKPSVVTLVLRNYWLLRSIIDIKNVYIPCDIIYIYTLSTVNRERCFFFISLQKKINKFIAFDM